MVVAVVKGMMGTVGMGVGTTVAMEEATMEKEVEGTTITPVIIPGQ